MALSTHSKTAAVFVAQHLVLPFVEELLILWSATWSSLTQASSACPLAAITGSWTGVWPEPGLVGLSSRFSELETGLFCLLGEVGEGKGLQLEEDVSVVSGS